MSVLLGKKRVIMATQRILAEETISISEMRKHPTEYFTDHPIAVLNRNQTEGYMLGKELFESMVDLIRQLQPQETFTAKFQPTATQLKALAESSAQFLANAKEEDLGEFVE
jgi:antitoxin YafN